MTTKKAVLTMGLPGAGKSTLISKTFDLNEYSLIDGDKIKAERPDFDPKNPSVYHRWSVEQMKARAYAAVANGENLIYDGTGTNVEKMFKLIRDFQASGYQVTILYVRVTLQTAIRRNASRERVIAESIIREKYETISEAFEILSSVADKVTVINND